MVTITNTAEAELSFTQVELQSMHGPTIQKRIHKLLLAKMQEQGYPYDTLEDYATVVTWNSFDKAYWHVHATWVEKPNE
ncbi:MAG: hypothetical protein ACWGQW_13815 [bacterium]